MRNVFILAAAQAFGACGTIVLFTFGGIVGTRLAPAEALATLPNALAVVGVAVATLPATLAMRRLGRKPVFIGTTALGAAAALLAAWATASGAFLSFCAAGVLLGACQAVVLQYRFAATEHLPHESAGKAVGLVMIGTLVAAVIGPVVGERMRLAGGWPEFTGSFVGLAVLLALGGATLAWLGSPAASRAETGGTGRPLAAIAAQPAFVVAVLAGVTSYAVMSLIMTATPISMHVHDGMTVTETQQVISAHLLAMYAPSLASGWLTRTLGLQRMMLLGAGAIASCILISAYVGREFVHYFAGLALLGLGWNLLFVAGTTQLTTTYTPAERFKVQGLNDFAVFGAQAVASLLAGVGVATLGWAGLNLAGLPLVIATAAAAAWLAARQRAARRAAAPS